MNNQTPLKLHNTYLGLCLLATFSITQVQATSLQEAYQLAVNSDPLLQQSASRLLNSQENIHQAKAALLPTVNGTLQADWQDASNAEQSNSKAYGITLSQPVYSPALTSAYKKVKTLQQQSEISHRQSEQNLILRTSQSYLNAMLAQSKLTTSQAQERALKQRLDTINVQYDVGIIAITDVHEAKASYDNAKVDLIISEGALQNSLEALQRLTGTIITDINSLSDKYQAKTLEPNQADHWVAQAKANNLEVLFGKIAIESAGYDTRIASASRMPSVNLAASHSRTKHSLNGTYSNNKITLALSVPLFNGGSLSSQVRQAISNQNIAKAQQQDNIRAVTQLTRSSVRDIQTNVLAISARKQSITSSAAALDAISAGFDAGTRNIVDLLQAEQALFSAKNEYASARLNHIKLHLNLKYQLGTLSGKDITELNNLLIPAK
ncbi:MAG: TolC family outer membrane protein [Oceanospirillaceae bacterium]|nr:TolC family outer membrane protein [Oceanospirillaceae bacterium]